MSVHPRFDVANSGCHDCAAFHGEIREGKDCGKSIGTCHRFAPRPQTILTHFPATGEAIGSTEPGGSVCWPVIEHDEFWCLDWFPAKESSPNPGQEATTSLK